MKSPLSIIIFSTDYFIYRLPYYDCLIVAWSTGNCCYFLEMVQFFDNLILLHTLLPPSWMSVVVVEDKACPPALPAGEMSRKSE